LKGVIVDLCLVHHPRQRDWHIACSGKH
jgi:hypothetical protein